MRSTKELIGRVVENCSCSTPSFTVFNKQGHQIANIMGPHCSSLVPCYLGGNIVFYLTDPQNGAAMGSIMKKFYMKDVLTDSSDFGFSLHGGDMDEVTKAIMIGAVFCIVSSPRHLQFDGIMLYLVNRKDVLMLNLVRTSRSLEVSPQTRTTFIGNVAVGNAPCLL